MCAIPSTQVGRAEGELVGIAKGEQVGIAKGREEGEQIGIEKGRVEAAINMIRSGMDNDLIGSITAFPVAEIERLRKTHND